MRAQNKSEENFPPLSSDDQRPSALCGAATPLQNKEDEGDDGDGQQNHEGRMEEGRERQGETTGCKAIFRRKSLLLIVRRWPHQIQKACSHSLHSALCLTTADRSSIKKMIMHEYFDCLSQY